MNKRRNLRNSVSSGEQFTVTESLLKWLQSLFPSSNPRPEPWLFSSREPLMLPRAGASCNQVIIEALSSFEPPAAGGISVLKRGYAFTFTAGLRQVDVSATTIYATLGNYGNICKIMEASKENGADEATDFEHYTPSRVPVRQCDFELAIGRLESALAPIVGTKGTRLPRSHPIVHGGPKRIVIQKDDESPDSAPGR